MACVKKTATLVEDDGALGSSAGGAVSFEFGPSQVTEKDLDFFAKCKWFNRSDARVVEREMVP